MNAQWFSALAFISAVVLGYVVIAQRDEDPITMAPPVLAGYYLKDATIIETGADGGLRLRVTAADVQQDTRDNAVHLHTVKADYLAVNDNEPATHWVITAERGRMPANSDVVILNGGVLAKTINAPQSVTFATAELDIDTDRQQARTDQDVTIDIDKHRITGQGLAADLPREQLRLSGRGELRLAANETPSIATGNDSKISLPGIFDHEGLELRDGGIRLTKVRSKTQPLVQADEALASSTDLDNNRFTLRGNVNLDLPAEGKVQADSAVVTVRGSRIVHAIAAGQPNTQATAQANAQPVRFEHRRATQDKQTGKATVETARGHAQQIDYDVLTNLLVFTGDVWFSTGRFEWRGEEWQYNMTDGSGSTTRRSTTTVLPRPNADTPAPDSNR